MQTGKNGLMLIEGFEGFRPEAYLCPAGVWTIGFGSTKWADGKPIREGDSLIHPWPLPGNAGLTPEEAGRELLRNTLGSYEDAIKRLIEEPLNQNEFDAIVSFNYNLGANCLANTRTLKALNSGNKDVFLKSMVKWDKANGQPLRGLTIRRWAERIVFETPVDALPYSFVKLRELAVKAIDSV